MNSSLDHAGRLADLIRFHEILAELSSVIGGLRTLDQCDGGMMPKRGVYFFMERGEYRTDTGHGLRVVHVGSHAGLAGTESGLWERLEQHRGSRENGGGDHRKSELRLLLGDALQNLHGVSVPTWGKNEHVGREVREREQPLERLVSITIRRMPLLWVEVPDDGGSDDLHAHVERNAIALLSNCRQPVIDPPSPAWPGLHSGNEMVRESGLWHRDHVNSDWDPAFLDVMAGLVEAMKVK